MYFLKQSNSIRKKEAPNKLKYKLPSAVHTLVIYFCRGGILIVKWKGLNDCLGQNYLRIFFSCFSLLLQQRHQSRDWLKRIFQFFRMRTTNRAYFDTVAEKIASVDFLIDESKLFQSLLTRWNMCCQSKSTKWSRELFQTDVLAWESMLCVLRMLTFFFPTKRNCSWNVIISLSESLELEI